MGEGTSFKGRILVSLKVEVLEGPAYFPPGVTKQPCLPINESILGDKEEFLLFGCVTGLSMLDKKLVDKPVHLEISIGHCGEVSRNDESSMSSEWQVVLGKGPRCHSTTPPIKPLLRENDTYCSVPFGDSKPCVFIASTWTDLRWRMFHSNVLTKIAEKLESGILELQCSHQKQSAQEKKFSEILDQLAENCCHYLAYAQSRIDKTPGMNKLDTERWRVCQRELDQIVINSRSLKSWTNRKSLDEKLASAVTYVDKIKSLAIEPQDSLPDIFVWLMQGAKRIAYHRIEARDLIHSNAFEEKGALCSKMQSFYLKAPGVKSEQSMWRIQGQVTALL